jgi:preprotein translocase subunit YajC
MINLMFLNNLFAETAQQKGSIFSAILPFLLIFVIFYFLLIRPQQKQRSKHQDFLSKLKEGDEVITTSGIIGIIKKIVEQAVYLEISKGVEIKVLRASVTSSAKEAFIEKK